MENQCYTKAQSLLWRNGYPVVAQPPPPESEPPLVAPALRPIVPAAAAASPKPTPLPAWLQHSNQVLRFFGYFEEEVPYSPQEAWRVRRVVVLHFLEDGTTQVVEPPTSDGAPSGTLAARRRLAKDGSKDAEDGAPALGVGELGVGRAVRVHGREIQLVDADGFSREYLRAKGFPQPAAMPVPRSPIEEYIEAHSKPSGETETG